MHRGVKSGSRKYKSCHSLALVHRCFYSNGRQTSSAWTWIWHLCLCISSTVVLAVCMPSSTFWGVGFDSWLLDFRSGVCRFSRGSCFLPHPINIHVRETDIHNCEYERELSWLHVPELWFAGNQPNVHPASCPKSAGIGASSPITPIRTIFIENKWNCWLFFVHVEIPVIILWIKRAPTSSMSLPLAWTTESSSGQSRYYLFSWKGSIGKLPLLDPDLTVSRHRWMIFVGSRAAHVEFSLSDMSGRGLRRWKERRGPQSKCFENVETGVKKPQTWEPRLKLASFQGTTRFLLTWAGQTQMRGDSIFISLCVFLQNAAEWQAVTRFRIRGEWVKMTE